MTTKTIRFPDTELLIESIDSINSSTINETRVLVAKTTESLICSSKIQTLNDVPKLAIELDDTYNSLTVGIEVSDRYNKVLTVGSYVDPIFGTTITTYTRNPNNVKLPSLYSGNEATPEPIHTFQITFNNSFVGNNPITSVTIGCSSTTDNILSISTVPETVTPTLTDEYLPIEVDGVKKYIRLYE